MRVCACGRPAADNRLAFQFRGRKHDRAPEVRAWLDLRLCDECGRRAFKHLKRFVPGWTFEVREVHRDAA